MRGHSCRNALIESLAPLASKARKLLVPAVAIISIALILLSTWKYIKLDEGGTILPPFSDSDVVALSARLYSSDRIGLVEAVEEFPVPTVKVRHILKWLTPPFSKNVMLHPPDSDLLGYLRITFSNGQTVVVYFWWTGNKASAAFSVDRKLFFQSQSDPYYDGGLSLRKDILDAYEAWIEAKKQAPW